jgi:hypothetical protein
MLHHSARKLLARTHVLQCPFWSHEPLLIAVDSSAAAAARVVSTLTSRTLDRDHSSNSDNVGYHWPITPRKGTSWRQQSYSTGFQKVGALQQGMAEMVSHVIPMPSDIRYADLIVKRSDHLQVCVAHCGIYEHTLFDRCSMSQLSCSRWCELPI